MRTAFTRPEPHTFSRRLIGPLVAWLVAEAALLLLLLLGVSKEGAVSSKPAANESEKSNEGGILAGVRPCPCTAGVFGGGFWPAEPIALIFKGVLIGVDAACSWLPAP